MTFRTVVFLTAFFSVISPLHCRDTGRVSKAETITIEELRDHIFFLASDYLGGRVVGSSGYDVAAEYVAAQFRQAGLEPILTDSQGGKTFYQDVPMHKVDVQAVGQVVVRTPEGDKEFPTESIKMVEFENPLALTDSLPVVFVGYGIEEPDHGWNDLEGLDIKGKIAVVLMGAPLKDGKPVLPEEIHKKYLSIPGGQRKVIPLQLEKHAAVVLVVADEELASAWNMLPSAVGQERYTYAGGGERGDGDQFCIGIIKGEAAQAIFTGQEYNPLSAQSVDLEEYKTFELKDVSILLDVRLEEADVSSRNVVALVRGTDQELKDQYVTVGAHLDHVPPLRGQVRNGADDNASGCCGILEIAEAVAMNPPRRSVVFITYTAEEVGLFGSQHFVTDCPVPLEKVVVNINLDMIGRSDERSEGNRSHYVIGAERTDPRLREIISAVNARTVNWPLDFEGANHAFGGSDHVRFHGKGIPVAFFFSGEHKDLHRPTDDPENIDFEKMQKISQLVYEVVMELSNMDEPPARRNAGDDR
jgi:hypothetical protein